MVISLSTECKEFLTSKKNINRAGKQYKNDITNSISRHDINCYRLFRLAGLNQVLKKVITSTSPTINNFIIAARLKRLKSITRKLQRVETMKLSQMDDIIGIRVICENFNDVLKLSSTFEEFQNHKNTRNYIKTPKPTGYRGVHIVLEDHQELSSLSAKFTVEIQIRSYYQHIWAIRSEMYGEQVKEGNGPKDIRIFLEQLSRKIKEKEEDNPDSPQIELPKMINGKYLTVIGYQKDAPPIIDKFISDYEKAYNQLLYLEDNANANPLLLIGAPTALKKTHPIFMGTNLKLESWMPLSPR